MKLAPAPIVGWSNNTVYEISVSKCYTSTFANSVAATESSPASISGASTDIIVPIISRTDTEIVFAMALAPVTAGGRAGASQELVGFLTSFAMLNLGLETDND